VVTAELPQLYPWQEEIVRRLMACDQPGLDRLVFRLGMRRVDGVEKVMREALAAAPHDVQVWWSGECNCDGHLN
jgi:hypothetical protein